MSVRAGSEGRAAFAFARRYLALALAAAALIGCAADGRHADPYDVNDPLEDYNRVMFDINRTIDGVLMKPAAELYVLVLPTRVQRGVSNLLDNLGEPLNAANNLFQGKVERAGASTGRFVINSTLGLIGIFEVADEVGLERAPEDFGQTLASWGFGEGPFLVLPVLGPSTPRDALGLAVDSVADPVSRVSSGETGLARAIARGVERRAAYLHDLEVLEQTSIDFYAAIRELYRQFRANEIRDGAPAPAIPIPMLDLDDGENGE